MKQGKLIVFEGINGCGKSTQILNFAGYLFDLNRSNTIFLTREPNEFDENGKKAREMLASDGDPYKNSLNAARYMAFNRVVHNKIFEPMLEKGIDIISDRYYPSSFAFQHAQGVSYEVIAMLNQNVRVPDLTFVVDIPVEIAFKRIQKRDSGKRRKFDSHKEFMEKVRQNYLELPDILLSLMHDKSIVIINGDKKQEEVFENIKTEYNKRFN